MIRYESYTPGSVFTLIIEYLVIGRIRWYMGTIL